MIVRFPLKNVSIQLLHKQTFGFSTNLSFYALFSKWIEGMKNNISTKIKVVLNNPNGDKWEMEKGLFEAKSKYQG